MREDDGTPSGRPELFVDVIDRIRAGCDLLTMVSTGGANDMTIEERTTGLEAKPDISGVESGSMNFGDETFITPPPAGRGIIERATEAGIALEVEAFDVGHVVSAVRWLEEGILPPPLRINLVFGVPGGIDATPEALDAMVRPLPSDAFWTVTCIGRHHPRMLALALLHGAPGIRTGLEDVAYLRRASSPPPTPPWSRWRSGLGGDAGARGATQEQTQGAAAAWLSAARPRPERRRTRGRALVEPARSRDPGRDRAGRDRALRAARLPRDLDAGDRLGRRGAAGGDLPLVPEQGGDPRPPPGRLHGAADREGRGGDRSATTRPALRLAAAVREHVVFHGIHRREAFVTDSEIRALTEGPRDGADRQARRLPGDASAR